MDKIRVKAPGKINLGLDIIGKRENGYHDVRMIMQTVSLCDNLELEKCEKDEIRLITDKSELPVDERNIVYRAIQLIKEEYEITSGVVATLSKRIPMAAGMGGGSADAAAALLGMNELFSLKLSEEILLELGLRLGADVPFLIRKGTALAEGIGEKISTLPTPPPCFVLLVKPRIDVSTKEVYELFDSFPMPYHPDIDGLTETIKCGNLEEMCKKIGNSLEGVTTKLHPVVEEMKWRMKEEGAEVSMMTGSGPTVFGIFKEKETANRAKERFLQKENMDCVLVTEWFNKE